MDLVGVEPTPLGLKTRLAPTWPGPRRQLLRDRSAISQPPRKASRGCRATLNGQPSRKETPLLARHGKFMRIAGTLALACSVIAVVGVADAATSHHKRHQARRSSTAGSASSSSSRSTPGGPPGAETELSGEAAAKAKAAALAAVPGGTVLRASTEDPSDPSKAAYEVHVRKSDGSEVEVQLDSSYKVLAVHAAPAHGG